mgnify:CR=1 FL=1
MAWFRDRGAVWRDREGGFGLHGVPDGEVEEHDEPKGCSEHVWRGAQEADVSVGPGVDGGVPEV